MNIVEIMEQLDDDLGLLFKTDQWLNMQKTQISAEASDILNRLKVIDNAISLKKVLNGIDIGSLRNVYAESSHGNETLTLELIKSYLKSTKMAGACDEERKV